MDKLLEQGINAYIMGVAHYQAWYGKERLGQPRKKGLQAHLTAMEVVTEVTAEARTKARFHLHYNDGSVGAAVDWTNHNVWLPHITYCKSNVDYMAVSLHEHGHMSAALEGTHAAREMIGTADLKGVANHKAWRSYALDEVAVETFSVYALHRLGVIKEGGQRWIRSGRYIANWLDAYKHYGGSHGAGWRYAKDMAPVIWDSLGFNA